MTHQPPTPPADGPQGLSPELDPSGLHEARLIQFRVKIGHTSVTVRGADRGSAVAAARRRLCAELPRMWDVIEQLDESRFEVEPLPGDPPPSSPPARALPPDP